MRQNLLDTLWFSIIVSCMREDGINIETRKELKVRYMLVVLELGLPLKKAYSRAM